jgi:NSS family neurotransmitter:Na+ symporter
MAKAQRSEHGEWSSGLMFVLAATGSAVGLGNLWRFPYQVAENGGAAFVFIYLLCILLVGLPIIVAEITLGRRGKQSPINSLRSIAVAEGVGRYWTLLGWLGVAAGFLILSFYSVVGGWTLYYIAQSFTGAFQGMGVEAADAMFTGLTSSPWAVVGWHTLFMLLLFGIVVAGVRDGIQRTVTLLMPLLLVILVLLVGYGMAASGSFNEAAAFLFKPDFSEVTANTFLTALGQAFFTLSLGMGAIMVYGAYLPQKESIPNSAAWIVGMDTLTALLAGLAIFPIVFAAGMDVGSGGAGLVFKTLPIVFGEIPFGVMLAILFYILLSAAAVTSGMSLLEPATAYLTEKGGSRLVGAGSVSIVIWLLGIPAALSQNIWSDFKLPGGATIFASMEFVSTTIMLPLGGLLIAIFAGWFMRPSSVARELGTHQGHWLFLTWLFAVRFIAPAGVVVIFFNALGVFG